MIKAEVLHIGWLQHVFYPKNKGCLPSVKDRGPPAQDHLKGPKDLGKSGDFKLQWLQEGCCKPEMMINLEL